MSEYSRGDRVIGTQVGGIGVEEALGTVIRLANNDSILVEFDDDIGGHHGNDHSCKDGHGWFCNARHLTLIKPVKWETIVEVEVEGKLRK